MKLRLGQISIVLLSLGLSLGLTLGLSVAFGQLTEPKSDPYFSDKEPQPEVEESDVQLKRATTPVDTEVADDIAPPARHVIARPESQAPASFSVTRVRVNGGPKTQARPILLLTPGHNTIYTPGVITFSWKFTNPPKKKAGVILKIERLDGKTRYSKKVIRDKKLLELSPGEYKWQVVTEKPTRESRWRLFKVQETKSHSLTELYNGPGPGKKTKKSKPIISAYIREVEPDEAIKIDEPLPIPESLRRAPAQLDPPEWVKPKKSN